MLPKVAFFGVDWGRKNGDMSCEVEFERLPDGALAVKDMRAWKHDLELEANKMPHRNGKLPGEPR